MKIEFILVLIIAFSCTSCQNRKEESGDSFSEKSYTNPLLDNGAEPWAIFHEGRYFYTQGSENKIILWETTDITDLRNATQKIVWIPQETVNSFHLWGPEIHFINNKWYIYFAADDGNMDNHQIYVIENSESSPMEGEFIMKGRISTDKENNWAIHASTFEHNNERYMIWCGWQKRRINEETQCIYIARMENPWTLSSERILISMPEYEWERQWISPDGTKTAYPVYVNEAPQYFYSREKDKILIYYSASGSWTPYYCTGLLIADAKSDLLDPFSWEKASTPVLVQNPEIDLYGPGSVSFIPSPDQTEWYVLYHARKIPNDAPGAIDSRTPRLLKVVGWDEKGLPIFDPPVKDGIPLPIPAGTS
ncbi:MAG: glycoside hydrolase family 43 protein [Tannerellaceae bacterium]|nr:glycoside hydrolase family 43 protein [Tannerellaceae bacterium]